PISRPIQYGTANRTASHAIATAGKPPVRYQECSSAPITPRNTPSTNSTPYAAPVTIACQISSASPGRPSGPAAPGTAGSAGLPGPGGLTCPAGPAGFSGPPEPGGTGAPGRFAASDGSGVACAPVVSRAPVM